MCWPTWGAPGDLYVGRPLPFYVTQSDASATFWPLAMALGLAIVVGPLAAIAVAAIWARRRARPGCCSACGYDLRGNLAATNCPECGAELHDRGRHLRV